MTTAACLACRADLALPTSTLGALIFCAACGAGHSVVARRDGERARTLIESVREPADALAGELAARFDVVGRLGRGAEGEVLRVRPRGATRDYALKWSRAAAGESERASREACYSAVPSHPNVLAPLQVGMSGGCEYLVFDLVEGESLAALLAREPRLPAERAVELAHQVLRALAHVHAHGVIHRDVKPANLLLERDGTVRLTDFGVATAVGAAAEGIVGTLLYMAPEQVTGDTPLPASDVYAFGGVLYRMIAGQCPFEATPPDEVLMQRVCEPAPPVESHAPDCPAPLAAFVARCLAVHPAERPTDGREALCELAEVQRACGFAEYVEPAPPALVPRSPREEARRALAGSGRWLAEAAASAVVFAGAVRAEQAGATLLAWLAALGAIALLAHALAGLSTHVLGAPSAWWRSLLPSLAGERLDAALLPVLGLSLAVGLFVMLAFMLAGWLALAFASWTAMACGGVCALVPAVAGGKPGRRASGAGGAPELRVLVRETGWMYRSDPGGPERPLASRIPLAEGLNRLEVWLAGGRRRSFLIWGAAGPPCHLELVETPEGPRAYGGASRP